MSVVWGWIDPLAPARPACSCSPPFSIGRGCRAGIRHRAHAPWLALVVPLLALSPPAFVIVGVIWPTCCSRRCGFSPPRSPSPAPSAALLCAAAAGARARPIRRRRPRAAECADRGADPRRLSPVAGAFRLKRALIAYVPLALALYGLVQVVYYDVSAPSGSTRCTRCSSTTSAGTTHFSGVNQFPVTWTAEQERLLTPVATIRRCGTCTGTGTRADS